MTFQMLLAKQTVKEDWNWERAGTGSYNFHNFLLCWFKQVSIHLGHTR